MSFQWTLVAGYLYFEIALVMLMILPIFSPKRWHKFFKSRLFAFFREHVAMYFYLFLGILSLFLIDAIREMRKYNHSPDTQHLSSEMKTHIKLFRAQRNFYITGFAIFLTFVIRRLITMLIIQDELSVKAEKIIKQAEATVNDAKTAILANTIQSNQNDNYDEMKTQLEEAKEMLSVEKEKVKHLDKEVMEWKLKYEEIIGEGRGDE